MAASGHLGDSTLSAKELLIASKKCEIVGLEHFRRMSTLVVCISSLVHALQRERGASNLYLGSGGCRYRERLQAMIRDSDEQLRTFKGALLHLDTEGVAGPGDGRLFSRLALAVHLLSDISVVRARVVKGVMTPNDAITVYSELLRSLIAVVFEAADAAVDPVLSRTLVAFFNFMQGKEFAGQERAVGAAGFAGGSFKAVMAERMHYLADAQARCFSVFTEFAETEILRAWEFIATGKEDSELTALRRLVREDGNVINEAPAGVEERWFDLTTARIDAMKTVEDHLQERLQALCDERLVEARQALASHRSLVNSLLEPGSTGEESFVVLYEERAGGGQAVSCHGDGVGPRLGRSLVDLVKTQSERLETMNDELIAARAALEERRLLDRAKALLMKHRKLREDEAYRLLRKTAMDQSRSIGDVARAMIAVAEVWARET